ncbi:MAG: hypothetical protein JRH11_13905 [Deltaproteobacteria bacterium]|nr:hypothetical protein [Deltaproteobacteria bacterium]
MSWEPIEEFPRENRGGGGAFRGQAMPVVARRRAPTLPERLRLLWHSTPELTYRRSVKRLVLTPGHLYVERFDGDRARVARGCIRGRRLDRGCTGLAVSFRGCTRSRRPRTFARS